MKKILLIGMGMPGMVIVRLLSIKTTPSPYPILAESAASSAIRPPTRDEFNVSTIHNYEFPTIQERFKYYMGSWADKTEWTCSADEVDAPPQPNNISPLQWNKLPQLISINDLKLCSDDPKIRYDYCSDAYYVLSRAARGVNENTAGLFVFGDKNHISDKPFVIKSRSTLPLYDPKESIPIIWPLNMKRHYEAVDKYKSQVKDAGMEYKLSSKKNILFWRGGFTGSRAKTIANWLQHNVPVPDVVEIGAPHKMLDIKKDHPWAINNDTRILDMQPYKYLLSLEGNDVASVSITS